MLISFAWAVKITKSFVNSSVFLEKKFIYTPYDFRKKNLQLMALLYPILMIGYIEATGAEKLPVPTTINNGQKEVNIYL